MDKKEKERRITAIIDFINSSDYTPMKPQELAELIQVPKTEAELFQALLEEMIKTGDVILTAKKKVISPRNMGLIKGTFTANARGFGFLTPELQNLDGDIFIPAHSRNGANHRDLVLCQVNTRGGEGRRKEGAIVRIISRGYKEIVGEYRRIEKGGVVAPRDKRLGMEIRIPAKKSGGAIDGNLVAVQITKAADGRSPAEGKVTNVLGHLNDPGTDITGVLYQQEVPIKFSEKVFAELETVPDSVSEQDAANRRDFRDTLTITVDGEDAKDLDDAVSLTILPNGNYKLSVFIADVAHYVREGSELDKEAYLRGTSIYLADRVVPMLPHKLSNGICSLNPREDRLALACLMEINSKGMVVSHEICETVINVNHRMTYKLVDELLTDESSDKMKEYGHLMETLKNMETLCAILREKRIKRGALEFDFPEAKIKLDEAGKPIDIIVAERTVSTSIIEEFMLICNETVAEEYFYLEYPFVFRSHEEPDGEKIRWLACFAKNLGYSMKGKATSSGAIQKLLAKIESTPEEAIINRVALRSLKQARYMPQNLGHFGLAAKYYCHFTSPIRRYPDLQIHRIIKANLNGKLSEKYREKLNEAMPEICKHCSFAERVAEGLERDVENLKKAEYMADKVGQIYEGVISGVTSWGVYVELPNTVEGMIPVSELEPDEYVYDKEKMTLTGELRGKVFKLGAKVRVKLVWVDTQEGKLNFLMT